MSLSPGAASRALRSAGNNPVCGGFGVFVPGVTPRSRAAAPVCRSVEPGCELASCGLRPNFLWLIYTQEGCRIPGIGGTARASKSD
ncbi:Lactosylceramide alpha-2,3-sialyltransferase [Clarias magur]|uniref:Lactosylceramide alpha-2,3-sialyltransferase n=1 Tax=Clarias magur TaxID=1594786 RepID=A0A8J4XDQ7_CLAMG|nr:Lactosylceramide alpha-2,3-sialyltransferase [Clarias magur]